MGIVHEAECDQCGGRAKAKEQASFNSFQGMTVPSTPTYSAPDEWIIVGILTPGYGMFCSNGCASAWFGERSVPRETAS